jgi:peptide/nickel transport system permease protein
MGRYIVRRLLVLIPTLLGMSMLIFLMLRLMPGDIVDALVGTDETITAEEEAMLRASFGLDKPIPVQYLDWMGEILKGNLGTSFRSREPITQQLLRSLPITVELALLSVFLSVIVAIPLGVISAVRQNSKIDFLAHIIGLAGLSLPSFWLATLFLLASSLWLHWIPPVVWISPLEQPVENLKQMFLPALALSIGLMAVEMRMTRASTLEVLRQDYVRTARAKGLRERQVLFRHALRNALIPVITVIGLQIGALMGGSVIIEQIFGLPGVGWMMLQGVYNRDYPVVQITSLFLAVIFVFMNLFVDLAYAFLDPRISYD